MKYGAWYQNKTTLCGKYRVVEASHLIEAHKLAEKKRNKNEWYCWIVPWKSFQKTFL